MVCAKEAGEEIAGRVGKGNAVVCGMWGWKVVNGKVGGVKSMGG